MRVQAVLVTMVLGMMLNAPLFGAAKMNEAPEVKPSEDKGKLGEYTRKTSVSNYSYGVYVPKSYSETNPAGLFIHFRGQGGCAQPANHWLWREHFLEPFNLIGICMVYPDGDNSKDTAGKVQAAAEALAQTIADYKVLAGRGSVSSFSGGGGPHGYLYSRFYKTRGKAWPFCHMAIYGSNYRGNIVPDKNCPMGWFIAFGEKEYGMAGIGPTALGQFGNIIADGVKGGNPDLYLNIIKDKGHSIEADDVEKSARAFRRSDLAFAPVLYEDDYPEADFKAILHGSNNQLVGDALTACNALLAKGKLAPELQKKAQQIKTILEKRVKALLDCGKELAVNDALLANYYGKLYVKQLGPLPEGKELSAALAAAFGKPEFAKALSYHGQLEKNFRKIFNRGAKPDPATYPFLEEMKGACGEKSLLGGMAVDFLKLK